MSVNTIFLLMAQYGGKAVIPLEDVCRDYFSHLSVMKFQRKAALGELDIPVFRAERSQKGARGVHIADLADYIDRQRAAAQKEYEQLKMGRSFAP